MVPTKLVSMSPLLWDFVAVLYNRKLPQATVGIIIMRENIFFLNAQRALNIANPSHVLCLVAWIELELLPKCDPHSLLCMGIEPISHCNKNTPSSTTNRRACPRFSDILARPIYPLSFCNRMAPRVVDMSPQISIGWRPTRTVNRSSALYHMESH